tara:strand:- start:264 stop:1895 length:1632 start_codon:yes stop_codon:yes gene_type:complete
MTDFDKGLEKSLVNFNALSPIDFLARSADVYGDRTAIIYESKKRNWKDLYIRCKKFAHSLSNLGIKKNDTVAVMLPNIPEMVEVHFSIPMVGAVLNTLNIRLDYQNIFFMLEHGEAKLLIIDVEFYKLIKKIKKKFPKLIIIKVEDMFYCKTENLIDLLDYEKIITEGDENFNWKLPFDEWDAISLNYTSGTTGEPKGVVYHHRGATLNAISNILEWDLPKHFIYLWTLPMFHCNGWCFPWTIAARAGVNVCLRKFETKKVLELIANEKVTHYCGAPIIQDSIASAPNRFREKIKHKVSAMVAASSPSERLIEKMEEIGFDLTHVYGLTEVYGPATVCAKQENWDSLNKEQKAKFNSRQGVRYHMQSSVAVLNPKTLEPVLKDGRNLGEIMFRGNICMKGYLKNFEETKKVFSGDWFHTGDLAVIDKDGYIFIKDRAKDIIISGGENISSIEIEDSIYKIDSVLSVAVVAAPDKKWGEVPCAFIETKEEKKLTKEEVLNHCRSKLAGFKVPKIIIFTRIPKTITGKIQKFKLRAELKKYLKKK